MSPPVPPARRRPRAVRTLALTLALLGGTVACAARGPWPEGVGEALDAPPEAARVRLEAALASADAVDRPWVLVALGEQERLAGEAEAARTRFQAATEASDDPAVQGAARLGLALLDAPAGHAPAVATTLESVPETEALPSQNAERFAWLARWSQAADGLGRTEAHARRARRWAGDDVALRTRVEDHLAGRPLGGPGVAEAVDGGPLDGPRGAQALEAARAARDRGDLEAVRRHARAAQGAADPALAAEAASLLAGAEAQVDPGVVGVLLPLEGRYGAVGKQVSQALQFGWSAGGGPAKLVVVDSGASPASAVAALETLVSTRRPLAVLGPLLSDEAPAVAEAADRLGVPLVSLSQALDTPRDHVWVAQAWTTLADQVDALLDHTMAGEDGMRRFAVFAPQSGYGDEAVSRFEAGVVARGGEIVASVRYDPASTEHLAAARALSGKSAGADEDTPPAITVDAVFLPDGASRVPLAAAALAYENFAIGAYRPQQGSRPVPLLGLSAWNSPDLVHNGGMYLRKGLFPDVFVPPPGRGLSWYTADGWKDFVEAWRAEQERAPTALEVLAADAANVLAQALRGGPTDRIAAWHALVEVAPSGTVSGVSGFDPDTRRFERSLRILSVRHDGFAPVADDDDE